jgi:hypothetical protein
MKLLLLHPEDDFQKGNSGWDLVVDLGRAPTVTYERWRGESDCRVVSLYDFAQGFDDLYRIRDLFRMDANNVVDDLGIDWFDVVSPMILADLQISVLLFHLAKEVGVDCELYSSRPDPRVSALQKMLGVECTYLQNNTSSLRHAVRHYRGVLSKLNFRQLTQIAQDKYDPNHVIRRRFARPRPTTGQPVFLLPSAYVNVSRTAVSYASLLPEDRFLLVTTRRDGELKSLPANVQMVSLDGYFAAVNRREEQSLLEKWEKLRKQLVANVPEFSLANDLGMFARVPGLMRWGLAIRNAWNRVFESENIAGCLSADDANPYTSIPLYLAQKRGIPALAVHHGALDYRMSLKAFHADLYLAKGELERDYLQRVCRAAPERIVTGAPMRPPPRNYFSEERPWLVFFTEPYGSAAWRIEEVYRDLLPKLCSLAQVCKLKLVFKLHPFESIKGHWNLLRKFLSSEQHGEINVVAGPVTPELCMKTSFAITVESTISLECASRGIPVFLCAWLQSAYGDYVGQYAKFGIGHILSSSDQILKVPELLATMKHQQVGESAISQAMAPQEFRNLLTGVHESPVKALA